MSDIEFTTNLIENAMRARELSNNLLAKTLSETNTDAELKRLGSLKVVIDAQQKMLNTSVEHIIELDTLLEQHEEMLVRALAVITALNTEVPDPPVI